MLELAALGAAGPGDEVLAGDDRGLALLLDGG